ncbi:hypothetical protein CAOG_01643 [Capsaspora owczarzaki ATCC 30864]|uniref:Uncharacterized protein n=1 Tax=Capsaspora owczarzaki (strain ATCC 30864) TaxID=595528 RepID=A0A0D2WKU2_CAPO3|nr:hypothetical protein CAOG_01643 [Capsaspora owczarzaki ATCC 30864]KJE90313.1 hypothetical protein CAOG_001643 [Capsaspora owczarzaki ATCC 30864]|eukprot:XP_004364511.1 hypothetical protein CAOG_01643 [Capsaspora owczarzaki ATCC 30864]
MTDFNPKSFSLRAQKKLIGKMASGKVVKNFIDDEVADLLDQVYELAALEADKKEAQKLSKDLIKTVVKLGILAKNNQFSAEDIETLNQLRKKTTNTFLSLLSMYEVDFTFDKVILSANMAEMQRLLLVLLAKHLTEKSCNRARHVFAFYGSPEFLENIFDKKGKSRETLGKVCVGLNSLIDQKKL